jgi:pimeloyl-ACP methyl ester carboxylesterase
MGQEIQFCTTSDKVRIAYALSGSGPPFVKAANWMNHLEYDWKSPVWRHLMDEFSRDHQLIRYDERGTGLSDRRADDISFEAFVNDLEAVVDATGIERFPLFGISQGGPVAIAYANRHPEKVSQLILLGSFATGWKRIPNLSKAAMEKRQAEVTLIRHGWGNENPAFRQFWTTLCIPGGSPDEIDSFNELQKVSTSPETAARIFEALGEIDVSSLLPKLRLPVLVLHARQDATVGFEDGRRIASSVPGARFVPLESKNHLLMGHEPAWERFVSEVRRFLGCETISSSQTVKAVICPTCSRLYTDVSLNYCLDDGSKLSPTPDAGNVRDGDKADGPATQILRDVQK